MQRLGYHSRKASSALFMISFLLSPYSRDASSSFAIRDSVSSTCSLSFLKAFCTGAKRSPQSCRSGAGFVLFWFAIGCTSLSMCYAAALILTKEKPVKESSPLLLGFWGLLVWYWCGLGLFRCLVSVFRISCVLRCQ